MNFLLLCGIALISLSPFPRYVLNAFLMLRCPSYPLRVWNNTNRCLLLNKDDVAHVMRGPSAFPCYVAMVPRLVVILLRTPYCKDNSRSLGYPYVALFSYPHYLVCLHLLYVIPLASSLSSCLSLATQSFPNIWPELFFVGIKRAYKIVGGRVRLMRV